MLIDKIQPMCGKNMLLQVDNHGLDPIEWAENNRSEIDQFLYDNGALSICWIKERSELYERGRACRSSPDEVLVEFTRSGCGEQKTKADEGRLKVQ